MSSDAPPDPHLAWQRLVEALAAAGRRMDEATAALTPEERADGVRALARALANQLGRLEVDDAKPELAPFNGWRQKFYMDNPDCRYWVAEIARGGCYRIDGTARDAVFTSVNVYAGSALEARTVARAVSGGGGVRRFATRALARVLRRQSCCRTKRAAAACQKETAAGGPARTRPGGRSA